MLRAEGGFDGIAIQIRPEREVLLGLRVLSGAHAAGYAMASPEGCGDQGVSRSSTTSNEAFV